MEAKDARPVELIVKEYGMNQEVGTTIYHIFLDYHL